MKTVRELKVNEREFFDLLLTQVKEVQGKDGNPFCVLTFAPGCKERKIEARMWKTSRESVISRTPEMSVVHVALTGNEYNGAISYIADNMVPAQGRSVDEFIKVGRASGKAMLDYTVKLIQEKCMDSTAALPAAALLKEHEAELAEWAGATRVHHNYKGGLMFHMGTCASVCSRISPVIAPANVASINQKDTKTLLNCTYKMLSANTKGDLAALAKDVFKTYKCNAGHEEALIKAMELLLAGRIAKCYPFLDTDLLYAAAALRKCSVLSMDGMGRYIGFPAADAQIITAAAGEKADSEPVRMLIHCVLVDDSNDRSAVIPEAFLAYELEKLARMAVENMNAGTFNASGMTIAAAIHDIGKLRELSSDGYGNADYMIDGNLFGHTQMSIQMFIRAAGQYGVEIENISDILHCIASHHEKPEWGALTAPGTYEAKLVAAVDYIDSRLDIYDKCTEGLAPGEKDESVRKYIGTVVYKPENA